MQKSKRVKGWGAMTEKCVNNGTGVILEVGSDADLYDHVLSSYIAKHTQSTNSIDQFIAGGGFDKAFESAFGLPIGVVESLGEVS